MNKRDVRIDYARAVAVLMMILQHVCIFLHMKNITITYVEAIIVEVVIWFTKSAVPLFVIITGSVMLNDKKEFLISKGLKLSVGMVKIIVTWNIINAVYFYFNDGIKGGVGKLIYGNYWYLYMLVALYLLMPIVNLLVKNYSNTKIPNYIIIFTLVYELWMSYSLIIPKGLYGYASRLVDKLQLSVVTGYTGLLMVGFIIRKEHTNINLNNIRLKIIALMVAVLMLPLLVCSIIFAVKNNEYNYIYFDEFTAFLIGGVLFYMFQKLKISENIKGWDSVGLFRKFLLFIGTHSLGMYVISNIFLDIYMRLSVSIERFPNIIIGIIMCWIIMVIPSSIIVWIISKTPLDKIV